jgi:hypothetical protein
VESLAESDRRFGIRWCVLEISPLARWALESGKLQQLSPRQAISIGTDVERLGVSEMRFSVHNIFS